MANEPRVTINLSDVAPFVKELRSAGGQRYEYYNTFKDTVASTAQKYGISENILGSLIYSESTFDPYAKSKKSSATGIAQIVTSTALNPGYGVSPVDPNDPYASIEFAGAYLAAMLERKGNYRDAVAAYKGGEEGYTDDDLSLADRVLQGAGEHLPTFDEQGNSTRDYVDTMPADDPGTDDTIMGYVNSGLAAFKDFMINNAIGYVIFIMAMLLIAFSLYILVKSAPATVAGAKSFRRA